MHFVNRALGIAAALLLLATPSHGGPATNRCDITTPDGTTYERSKILRAEPDGLVIMHSRGITKLAFDQLPDGLRQEYVVTLPWYIEPGVAARYWPESIGDVLDALAPEIASAKAEHEQAAKDLEKPPEHNMEHWHRKFGSQYAYEEGKLLRVGERIERIRGKVLSVADSENVLVIDEDGDVTACRMPATAGLVDGEYFGLLGRPIGTYRYTSAIGAAKQVHYCEYIPSIALDEFTQLGEEAFPEIEDAKRAARERLATAEREARERLRNAGRSTYERLLADKVREEATQARANAAASAQRARDGARQRQEEEVARRRQQADRAEQARRVAAAKREKFRLKGPEDSGNNNDPFR